MSQAPPTPNRRSALRFLLGEVDDIDINFFNASRVEEGQIQRDFAGFTLRVMRRTLSDAYPANVKYEINLGQLVPSTQSRPLTVYVLFPKEDKVANRAAFKHCLERLSNDNTLFTSQKEAP